MVTTPNFTDGTWNVVSTTHVAGDPNGDILWQNINNQAMVLWQQDGAATTSAADLPSLDNFDAVVVGDFDGDGRSDQFLRNGANGANKMLFSPTGTLGNTVTVANLGWDFSASADYNGDGKDDIFSFLDSAGLIQTWQMNGAIVADTRLIASGYGTGDKLHSVFNAEGFSTFDSLWFDDSANNYNITSYTGGVQTITDIFTVAGGRTFQTEADFDGDGSRDFLFLDRVGTGFGDAEVIFTNGTSETGRIVWDASDFGETQVVAGGDFDNDGNAELLLRNGVSGDTQIVNAVGGNDASTTMFGSDGVDLIDGRAGNDRIFGLGGDDFILGGDNNDTIDGGIGDDTIEGNSGDDHIRGGAGNDFLEGEAGNDNLMGGAGDDIISTGSDFDIADGGSGDDSMYGSSSSGSFDIMRGGLGDDFIMGVGGRTILEGGSGNDHLHGGTSLDYMYGDSGDDVLIGGLSLDWLEGGSGNDILIGTDIGGSSGQSDTLTGGSGRDYFVMGNEDQSYYAGTGRAVVTDFTTLDKVLLHGLSSEYDFIQNGADVEIRFDGTTNLVADILNATVADVTANSIYI